LRPDRRFVACCLAGLIAGAVAFASPARAVSGNGRLQVHHIDVGQGDGLLIISPLGQTALVDDGVYTDCTKVKAYLQALGVTQIDYHFASHYHADHVGCIDDLAAIGITVQTAGWDRGFSYTTGTYTTYVNTLGSKRRTLVKDQVILLDSLSAHPVAIKCVNLNGAGVYSVNGSDENAKDVVLKVSYGEFDAVMGGDLTGSTAQSNDVETTVGPQVGPVEVYKVHHHGSRYSSNDNWLTATQPKIGIISCGTGNTYGHPTAEALNRMHAKNVRTYWTETGAGATPNPAWDRVANGHIVVSATWEPGGVDTVRGPSFADTFTNSGTAIDTSLPTVLVTSPNGSEDWKAGSSHAVAWSAGDNVGVTTVDLAYSTDGGATYPNLIASALPNSGSYSWSVPDAPTSGARVRATAHDAAGNLGVDASDAAFTIDRWIVTASAGAGGAIAPSGAVPVLQGVSQGFTITPDGGSSVADVLVDGVSVGAVSGYTFPGVAADHTISASFTSSPVAVDGQGPTELALWSPAPNPGIEDWLLRFALPREATVRVEILDIAGRRLWLDEESLPAGIHRRRWDGVDLHGERVGSGIYFVRLVTPFGVRLARGVMLR
jgi:beta-lactamase superfamily II metal-dependent hydrolase